ncbi:histidine phosphatase family protein [Acrocarpospora macrocephala]|uniref:Phosphoglycerate mutase n=1 Tax=Acrocarpospora macrocephala TaxID=150177 RepID=A0A5M3WZR0_9ACTN|nr:histidine phosphatase family protein [Acrocarpospora macrocephala]GES14937.1 phosphoglycerate mutase [Acrocarpospora macrocephala]
MAARAARVIVVAHGRTAAVRAAAFPSPDDVLELPAAGDVVKGEGRAGPEERCLGTARWLGVAAVADPGLRDCDLGRWRGRTFAEVAAEEPEGVRAWLSDPGAAPHGGESVAGLIARMGEWLGGLPPGRSLAVTHPAVVRAMVVSALGLPDAAYWRVDVPPLGRVELSGFDGRWNLRLPQWGPLMGASRGSEGIFPGFSAISEGGFEG